MNLPKEKPLRGNGKACQRTVFFFEQLQNPFHRLFPLSYFQERPYHTADHIPEEAVCSYLKYPQRNESEFLFLGKPAGLGYGTYFRPCLRMKFGKACKIMCSQQQRSTLVHQFQARQGGGISTRSGRYAFQEGFFVPADIITVGPVQRMIPCMKVFRNLKNAMDADIMGQYGI